MYILLKTDTPVNIDILNKKVKAHYLYAKDLNEAKMYLDELEDTDNEKYWSKYYAKSDLKCCEEFNKYLQETILSPNKLTNDEIKELGSEAIYWLYDMPKEKLDIEIGIQRLWSSKMGYRIEDMWRRLVDIIDQYTQTKHNIKPWDEKDPDFNPISDLGLILPFNGRASSLGGALNIRFYKLIYYFDFLGVPIHNLRLRSFWKFYKKTMGVYAIGIKSDRSGDKVRVIPKPEEIYLQDGITHCIYDKLDYYCDGVKVPYWLYKSKKEDLNINDFYTIKNADARTIFIKKAGMEKFIEKGEIVDTWENYPDNEWWAKSEYKLIDMSEITVQEIVKYRTGENVFKYYRYAPYLCMKNQTTGEIHMEGVSPDCKDLYDALKMRYDLLDLSEYKIEDIK